MLDVQGRVAPDEVIHQHGLQTEPCQLPLLVDLVLHILPGLLHQSLEHNVPPPAIVVLTYCSVVIPENLTLT